MTLFQATFTHLKALSGARILLAVPQLPFSGCIVCLFERLFPRHISLLEISSKAAIDDAEISLGSLLGMGCNSICDVTRMYPIPKDAD